MKQKAKRKNTGCDMCGVKDRLKYSKYCGSCQTDLEYQTKPASAQHTPTPWKYNSGEIMTVKKYRGDPLILLEMISSQMEWKEAQANAAFIVHACNNHEVLVDALEGMLEWARRVKGPNPGMEVVDAHNALKLAKGE